MAMSHKALAAAWGTEILLHRQSLSKGFVLFEGGLCSTATMTVPMIPTAQKTSSQIHQSATNKAEQAVSFLSCTVELVCWESCLKSLALFKTQYEHTGPFPHGSRISQGSPRSLR